MKELVDKINKLRDDAKHLPRPLNPRGYAERIVNLKTREERAKALSEVPKEWQDLVKKHVENEFMRRKK